MPKDALWGWGSGEGDTWDEQSISFAACLPAPVGPALGSQIFGGFFQ